MADQIYYLSSLESIRFEPVRECRIRRFLAFESGKIAAVAHLAPSVIGQDFGQESDIDTVILTVRHEGVSIDPVSEFPCFVFITISRSGSDELESPLHSGDLEIIGWGELYRTRHDAEVHAFG